MVARARHASMLACLACLVSIPFGAAMPARGLESKTSGSAGGFDVDLAVTLALYSQVSYCPDENIMAWNCAYCKDTPQMKPIVVLRNDTEDSHGFIGYDTTAKLIVVAFRGTEDLRNWITDLNGFGKADLSLPFCFDSIYDSAAVHDGFYGAYISLQAQVHQGLSKAMGLYPDAEVIVTGHSLGAAISVLCGLDLACGNSSATGRVSLPSTTATVYNYGSPRIGNQAFSDTLKKLQQQNKVVLWRNTHWRDIIPHLPPEDLLGYEHSPTEIFQPEVWDRTFHVCDGSGEDENCADQFHIPSVDDHLLYFNISMQHAAC